ncbi:MAG: 4-hydroxy-tetrahydrodipicolinate reductase [Bacteroidales bacterium]|nr:4-hydroxy-tetrahydrodipicolinate reductase [Bacteroidales bacterium]MBN2820510.1 4-hydroxy-tetrahydrodipicolinate reductase [Bacteroidales bacterium]
MKIALLGYGKMGKEIEKIAISRNHEIVLKIDIDNQEDKTIENIKKADVAIDFSIPGAAYENILKCFEACTPIVSGTTGWLNKMDDVLNRCKKNGSAFFYASNYSVGVNLFFKVNKFLAELMNKHNQYDVSMEEVHHIHKLDEPSGTAITLAEGIIGKLDSKTGWTLEKTPNADQLPIKAIREGEVPGIHRIKYNSEEDFIQIEHSAYSRKGFALGAVLAAEFMKNQSGYKTMDDMLKLKA